MPPAFVLSQDQTLQTKLSKPIRRPKITVFKNLHLVTNLFDSFLFSTIPQSFDLKIINSGSSHYSIFKDHRPASRTPRFKGNKPSGPFPLHPWSSSLAAYRIAPHSTAQSFNLASFRGLSNSDPIFFKSFSQHRKRSNSDSFFQISFRASQTVKFRFDSFKSLFEHRNPLSEARGFNLTSNLYLSNGFLIFFHLFSSTNDKHRFQAPPLPLRGAESLLYITSPSCQPIDNTFFQIFRVHRARPASPRLHFFAPVLYIQTLQGCSQRETEAAFLFNRHKKAA